MLWPYIIHILQDWFRPLVVTCVRHSMPRFCPKRLKSNQHPYPELQAKAWNVSCQKFNVSSANYIDIMKNSQNSILPCVLIPYYGDLSSKCRVVIAWLSDALQDYMRRIPDDHLLKLMESCTMLGKSWFFILWASSMTMPDRQMPLAFAGMTCPFRQSRSCQDHVLVTPLRVTQHGGTSQSHWCPGIPD